MRNIVINDSRSMTTTNAANLFFISTVAPPKPNMGSRAIRLNTVWKEEQLTQQVAKAEGGQLL